MLEAHPRANQDGRHAERPQDARLVALVERLEAHLVERRRQTLVLAALVQHADLAPVVHPAVLLLPAPLNAGYLVVIQRDAGFNQALEHRAALEKRLEEARDGIVHVARLRQRRHRRQAVAQSMQRVVGVREFQVHHVLRHEGDAVAFRLALRHVQVALNANLRVGYDVHPVRAQQVHRLGQRVGRRALQRDVGIAGQVPVDGQLLDELGPAGERVGPRQQLGQRVVARRHVALVGRPDVGRHRGQGHRSRLPHQRRVDEGVQVEPLADVAVQADHVPQRVAPQRRPEHHRRALGVLRAVGARAPHQPSQAFADAH